MRRLSVNLKRVPPALTRLIAGALKKGRVLILPTDTIYGLSCRADDLRAVKRIYSLKKRQASKAPIVLVSDFKQLAKYAMLSGEKKAVLKKIWGEEKRPTTVILPARGLLPKAIFPPARGLALRLPKSEFLIKIIKAVGQPLISTSLNLSGHKPLLTLKNWEKYFSVALGQPNLVVDAGPAPRRRPSRLWDYTGSRPRLIRA